MLQVHQHHHLDEQLSHLLEVFKEHEDSLTGTYLERRINSLGGEQLSVEEQLKHLVKEIESKESLCKEVIRVSIEYFEQTRSYLTDSKEKLSRLSEENAKLKEQIASVKEDLDLQRHDDLKASMAYEQLERKVYHLEDVRVNMHEQFEQEKEQLKKTFIAEVDNKPCELQFNMLVEENRYLLKEADNNKKQMQLQLDSMHKLEATIERLEEKLEKSDRLVEQLKQGLLQKDETILALTQEKEREIEDNFISSHREREPESSLSHQMDVRRSEIFTTEPEVLENQLKASNMEHSSRIFNYTDKLIDECDIHESPPPNNPQAMSVNVNGSPKKLQRLYIDPYYAHYVLTSQSVKIKEDRDDYLGVDMKPFYQEIIDKRIPMHLWDQWIRNKLTEIGGVEE